jgi:hypothetical protein
MNVRSAAATNREEEETMNEGDETIERDDRLIAAAARIRASIPDEFTQYRMRRAWRARVQEALHAVTGRRLEGRRR